MLQTPLHRPLASRALAGELRRDIIDQRLNAGDPILSTRQIAKKYGVSYVTATRAIKRLVEEGLVYRVHGSGTFVSQSTAEGALRVGFAFPRPSTGSGAYMTQSVIPPLLYKRLTEAGHAVQPVLPEALQDKGTAADALDELDGVLISSAFLNEHTLPALQALSVPVGATHHEEVFDTPLNQVIPHLYPGYREAAEHLKALGADRVTIATQPGGWSNVRLHAFQRAARDASFSEDAMDVLSRDPLLGDDGRLNGRSLGEEILARKDISAVFCTSDFLSFGIADVFREQGVRLGSDIALVSYDDMEGRGLIPFGEPQISSVRNPMEEVARAAVDLLFDRARKIPTDSRVVRVPTSLVIRASSTR